MKNILVFILLIISLSSLAQESEKYYWEGFKYQSKLKLEKATDAYCKAIKASESKPNINSRELYYLTFAHGEIAKIYSGASIFSNNTENILTAYNSVKKVFEYYAILYQRNELAYIKDFERVKILTTAKESLKNIYTIKPDLFPSNDKINNDTNTTLGVELDWKNDYLAIVKKYTTLNKSIEENYLKDNDVILEITTANDYKYYSLLDFIITNRIPGDGSDGDVFRVKLVRNGQVEYTQIKKYLKQTKIEPISAKENRPANNKEDKTVTLTVSGTGKTKEDAQKNALRSAIEQAFGAFVSAKTEILNDSVIKDEIVSITSGNIKSYEVVAESQLSDKNFVSTLTTVVSLNKLISFAESKGVVVEFKGSAFAMNIRLQKLNEEAEFTTIKNLCKVNKDILSNSLDYSIEVGNPKLVDGASEQYEIDMKITATPNENYSKWYSYFIQNMQNLSMSKEERESYNSIRKEYFTVNMVGIECASDWDATCQSFQLRNKSSYKLLIRSFIENQNILHNYSVIFKIDTIIGDIYEYKKLNKLECQTEGGLQYNIDDFISTSFPSAIVFVGCGAGQCYRNNLACINLNDANKPFNLDDFYTKTLEILFNNKPISFAIKYRVGSLKEIEMIEEFNIERRLDE